MGVEFEDKTGQPRSLSDVDEAIAWCQANMINLALSNEGLILMPTILDCLKAYRNVVAELERRKRD